MPKASIAEWMHSLATSKESAASITGDLVERREPWFWVSVIRTVFSFSMRDLAADPSVQLFPLHDRDVPYAVYLVADVVASQFLVGRAVAKRVLQDAEHRVPPGGRLQTESDSLFPDLLRALSNPRVHRRCPGAAQSEPICLKVDSRNGSCTVRRRLIAPTRFWAIASNRLSRAASSGSGNRFFRRPYR
jgi:hypothetical protein